MKKKICIVLRTMAIVVVIIVLSCNMYTTKYYSYSWGKARIHISVEEVNKITCSYFDSKGEYIVLEYVTEEDLALWKNALTKLNETTFVKNKCRFGQSFSGIIIEIELKDVKDEFKIIYADETRIAFGAYSWNSVQQIELPIEWGE